MRPSRWPASVAGLALAALSLSAGTARAQEPERAALIGRAYDSRTSEALTNAEVLIDMQNVHAVLSSQARFVISNLEPGRRRIDIRVVGYKPLTAYLEFLPGQTIQKTFELEFTGEKLPDLEVEEKASKTLVRFNDFERRRARGVGHFITRDEIRNRGYMNMGDALRTVKGVKVNCGAIDCRIQMARAAPGCGPSFWVDGVEVRSFAESTPIADVQGIEVYRGSGEIPAEFTGSTAGCGVVVIWTRAAP